jgi:hypothetical protein
VFLGAVVATALAEGLLTPVETVLAGLRDLAVVAVAGWAGQQAGDPVRQHPGRAGRHGGREQGAEGNERARQHGEHEQGRRVQGGPLHAELLRLRGHLQRQQSVDPRRGVD